MSEPALADGSDHKTVGDHIMSYRLLTLAAASLLPLSVQAADLPKQGSDNLTNTSLVTSYKTMQQGTLTFETYEIDGVARNDSGGAMFNLFGVRCVGMEQGPDPSEFIGNGTCTYTDTDGDNIFTPFSATGGRRG